MAKVNLFACIMCFLFNLGCSWVMNDINAAMLTKSVNDELSDGKAGDSETDDNNIFQQRISLIFPGTKWCGAGNTADNYDDLGSEREADECCRDHDYCPDFIPGGATKHNLTNEAFYTRLNCDCDNQFRDCLRSANTTAAKRVGIIYFNAISTKCFRKDYPVVECIKRGGWLRRKCVEYSYDTKGEKIYQWFHVKDY